MRKKIAKNAKLTELCLTSCELVDLCSILLIGSVCVGIGNALSYTLERNSFYLVKTKDAFCFLFNHLSKLHVDSNSTNEQENNQGKTKIISIDWRLPQRVQ